MINVTKTFFPPLEEYNTQLQRIWQNEWLTNRGELVRELESKLMTYLNVPNITLMTNGTLPIQIALKILGKEGEVITTPFSYVATTASIVWEQCTPVFVDIHPEYLVIDETKIEEAITPNTTAILATHVFGNPCNIEAIEAIAKKYNLAVIYDAAHCFGVDYKEQSIFNYGDVSTCSFHATKLFHTGEGGALVAKDEELRHKLYYSHNFGHNGPLDFYGLGINAKISELQAAMGLSVFPYMETIISERKKIVVLYEQLLDFPKLRTMKIRQNTSWNYSYYPVIFKSEEVLLKVQEKLNENNIFPRRYFYPSLNTIPYVERVVMPVFEEGDVQKICEIINNNLD
jgi:dTDP-4-amino-4,6-dideoxygalactose transaminase